MIRSKGLITILKIDGGPYYTQWESIQGILLGRVFTGEDLLDDSDLTKQDILQHDRSITIHMPEGFDLMDLPRVMSAIQTSYESVFGEDSKTWVATGKCGRGNFLSLNLPNQPNEGLISRALDLFLQGSSMSELGEAL